MERRYGIGYDWSNATIDGAAMLCSSNAPITLDKDHYYFCSLF
jgi:hypothetical protein